MGYYYNKYICTMYIHCNKSNISLHIGNICVLCCCYWTESHLFSHIRHHSHNKDYTDITKIINRKIRNVIGFFRRNHHEQLLVISTILNVFRPTKPGTTSGITQFRFS